MRNLSFFLGALLLVDGVFGVEKVVEKVDVSVMEGDSVTLKPHTVIPEDDSVEWWFGDDNIAKINKAAGLFSTSEGDKVGFKGKLSLDKQTGSLTITNITTNHDGPYTLKIRSSTEKSKIFNVTVHDVVESVSVVKGDTVTLHTGVTDIQRNDQILLKFGDQVINTDRLNGPDDKKTEKNKQTEDLTIRNIRRDQSGEYKLEINTSSMILHRKLHINISGEMTTVSVMEGEPFTLDTGLIEIKGYDLILWKFKDQLIAEINNVTNTFLKHDTSDKRFKDRLQLHPKIVSLIIGNSRISDSGDYQLNMSNSSTHTIQRNISVTVSDPGLSPGVIAGIVVGVLLLVVFGAAGLIYYCKKNYSINSKRPSDDAKKNDAEKDQTNGPLKDETVNSDDL